VAAGNKKKKRPEFHLSGNTHKKRFCLLWLQFPSAFPFALAGSAAASDIQFSWVVVSTGS
jgi:hypothetical protein